MKIIRAKVLGYCMGVRRAVEKLEKAIESSGNKKIFTLGPLIHNPLVMQSFREKGVNILHEENICGIDSDSVVVIRAHGTTTSVLKKLNECGCTVIDATCPKVLLSQKRAKEWSEKGYKIFLAGDKNHGEVVSICSYAENPVVIENSSEAKNLEIPEKSILLAQTTFSPHEFNSICQILKEKNKDLVVFDTICSATMERQNALLELKDKACGIIVIGGKNSSNTKRLYETALTICSRVCLIEKETEIPAEFFSLETVAITAGASTPDNIISQVENELVLGYNRCSF